MSFESPPQSPVINDMSQAPPPPLDLNMAKPVPKVPAPEKLNNKKKKVSQKSKNKKLVQKSDTINCNDYGTVSPISTTTKHRANKNYSEQHGRKRSHGFHPPAPSKAFLDKLMQNAENEEKSQ